MKPFGRLLTLLCIYLFALSSFTNDDGGKCTGKANCTVCSDCSRCAYCKSGASCGKSAIVSTKTNTKKKAVVSSYSTETNGQCKATTKKGSRCSRSSRSGGYCWQHGG